MADRQTQFQDYLDKARGELDKFMNNSQSSAINGTLDQDTYDLFASLMKCSRAQLDALQLLSTNV